MARTLTTALAATVVDDGRFVTQIDVHDVQHGQQLLSTDPVNDGEPRIKMVSGSISTDETRTVVGTGTAQLLVDQETADAVLPLLQGGLSPTAPARVHVRFRAPGNSEAMDYGVYEVDNVSTVESSQGVVMTVDVSDNSRRVSRARFWRPVLIGAKTPYATAFHTLLDDVLPESIIQIGPTTAKTGGLGFFEQDDRLSAVTEMATAIGFRFEWNAQGRGNLDILPDADADDEPIWTFVDGGNARVVSATRGLTDERSYNGVIAMGEAAGSDKPPVRAEYWDTNPSSPTYFDPNNPDASAYGPVPFFYVSQFITTYRQALDAARARLPKVLGLVEVLTLNVLPHPGIVPGDPILVERPRLGVSSVFVVQSVTLPLSGSDGLMTVTCRDRRVFL